jgi:IclR family transcriptional regulator, pca regulon regulatory protein
MKTNRIRAAASRRPRVVADSSAKSLLKGLQILGLFTPESSKLSLTDIARRTGITLASTHRIAETLIRLGFLKREESTKLFKLGPAAMSLSINISKSFDLLQIVKPFVDRLFEELNVSLDVAVVENDQLLLVYRREAQDTLVFNLPVLSSDVFHASALGKAYLMSLSPEDLERRLDRLCLVRRTPRTITNRDALRAEIESSRRRGYALNNEEFTAGLISIGAPLLNRDGFLQGIFTFDVSSVQTTAAEAERRLAPLLLRLTKELRSLLPV